MQAISPLDSRYYKKVQELSPLLSDDAFVLTRTNIEIDYLSFLLKTLKVTSYSVIEKNISAIKAIISPLSIARINEIEKKTNHDVKAIEYYLREVLNELAISTWESYIHYGLTSQDVNSLAMSIQIKNACNNILLPQLDIILADWKKKINFYSDLAMCGHTHGQISSPTTVGKELQVFNERLLRERKNLINIVKNITCKFGGATGNFRAHYFTYPKIEWKTKLQTWIKSEYDINVSDYTTQIDNYESYAEIFDCLCRINRILINFSRDMWLYGMKRYIKMEKKENEVGSSAMPHKINPIQFEHCEGVLMLANSMGHFFSDKLPQSRLQRDLTDSVVLRFVGEFFAMNLDGYKNFIDGLSRLNFNKENITADIKKNYCELISEAIQMVLRKHQIPNAYEQVKTLMRGNNLGIEDYEAWVLKNFKDKIQKELLQITPHTYLGLKSN